VGIIFYGAVLNYLSLFIKASQLISYRKIIDICCENRTKHRHTLGSSLRDLKMLNVVTHKVSDGL